jgi:hypothetical protein
MMPLLLCKHKGLTPLVKVMRLSISTGLELTRFVVHIPPDLAVSFSAFRNAQFPRQGKGKVILMLAFLQADSSKTNPRPSFRMFTSGLRFLAADYIFFVIAHDVVRHNNGPLSRLTLMSRRIPNLGKSSRPLRLINATAYRSDNGIHTNHS